MSVLYLTTHVQEDDFASKYGKVASMPNPAGENFHGKVLRALALVEDVHCYSLVPPALGKLPRNDFESDDIHYTYVYSLKNRYARALLTHRQLVKKIEKEAPKGERFIILYDALNLNLSRAAKCLSKSLHAPRIPVLTDEIRNITGVPGYYADRIHTLNADADASIALTEGLADCYVLKEKPHYVQPVFVEEQSVEPKKRERPYIYYGGALFVKDGTKDLIDCYKALHMDYDLVISGHGQYESEVEKAAKEIPGIVYLGQISKEEHYSYIAGASLAINPRHYNRDLDALAVPSKVMEYLCFAPVIASTHSTPLQEEFGEAINWISGDLESFLKAHLDEDGKFVKLCQNDAKSLILEKFGKQKTAFNLQRFLKNLP